ncbi:MAG: DUF7935 family protein, partial [Chitinophagaceae bacterium]
MELFHNIILTIWTLLGLAFVLTVVLISKQFLPFLKEKTNQAKRNHGTSTSSVFQGNALSLQLQAYERLVLLMERISPQQLIQRLYQPELTAEEMKFLLLKAIQSEFDHNLSQQIYVSETAWDAISNAKEQEIHFLHQLY